MTRRPVDPEEELRWMAQEVRGYVEAVLNSLAANVPKVGLNLACPLHFSLFFRVKPHLTWCIVYLVSGSCSLPSGEGQRRHAY